MISLVIVSHSTKLAEGVAELARGMAGSAVRIAATGGLDLPDHPLGTDGTLVLHAIEEVYSEDGVLVLVDLGSAVLSTEMALEQIASQRRERVLLCDAPLVEGAIAAAVSARLGRTLEEVMAEARGAAQAKTAQFRTTQPPADSVAEGTTSDPPKAFEHEIRLTVRNRLGLHSRPAAKLVQTLAQFRADVEIRDVTNRRGPANAKSINAVTTLGVLHGHEILVIASGPEAEMALAAIRALVDGNFGDTEHAATSTLGLPKGGASSASGGDLHLAGIPASPGIAIGEARLFRPIWPSVEPVDAPDPEHEWRKLLLALDKTRQQITVTRDALQRIESTASIFDAHLLFLDDHALQAPAQQAIYREHRDAATAWKKAVEEVAAEYRALDDAYLRARAADILDVGRQVLLNLLGSEKGAFPALEAPVIVVASDLSPSEIAHLDPSRVLAICTALGSANGHSAILARNLGIPTVVALGEEILGIVDGTKLVVDGDRGDVWPSPSSTLVDDYRRRAERARVAQAEVLAQSIAPAKTRDGRPVKVLANVGSPGDSQAALEHGADGVGLLRTESLFLGRSCPPTEDEQYRIYCSIARTLPHGPLTIRTMDIGGDKTLPYVQFTAESNPFLGLRGIRLCLSDPDLFRPQLRAIARVAAEFPVKVMFPMITTLKEWEASQALFAEAREEVQNRGIVVPSRIEMGMMVEVPAVALCAAPFAASVDFFSIGTNDLTQYALATDRNNAKVATLADAFHPAVLQMIASVVDTAHEAGKCVSVCGELAGEPLAIPLLVGLGVDELSMNPRAIPQAKQIIRTLDSDLARAVGLSVLRLESPEDVRTLVRQQFQLGHADVG